MTVYIAFDKNNSRIKARSDDNYSHLHPVTSGRGRSPVYLVSPVDSGDRGVAITLGYDS